MAYAYISDDFTPARYGALMMDHLQFFPEPQPNDFVTGDTLTQILTYADATLRAKLGAKVILVDQPGPGVARMKLGFTAVSADKRNLKPYQYLPIALVITGVAWGVGGRPEDSSLAFEVEVTDSLTHALLFASVRGGTGERVTADKEGEKKVSLDDRCYRPRAAVAVQGGASEGAHEERDHPQPALCPRARHRPRRDHHLGLAGVTALENRLRTLQAFGQSVWLDYMRRSLVTSRELRRLIDEDGLWGVTSNPAIFGKAVAGSSEYKELLEAPEARALDAKTLYEKLAVREYCEKIWKVSPMRVAID
jgi:hypothetical protein